MKKWEEILKMDTNNMMNEGYEQQVVVNQAPEQKNSNTKAILALVFGILSLVISCCCTYLGIILGVVGIVLAVLSRQDNGGKFSGMAIGGMVCSIVAIVLSVVAIVLVLSGLVANPITEYMDM